MRASVVIEFLTKGLDKAKAGERSLRDIARAADGAEREASGLARAESRIADAGNRMAAGQARVASTMHRSTEAMRRQKSEAIALSAQQDRLFRKSQQQARASTALVTAGGLGAMRGVGGAFLGGLGLGIGGAAGAGLIAKETMQLAARVEYERDQLQVLGEYSDEKARLYDKILKPAGARRGVGTMGAYGVFGELMAGGLSAENASAMTDSVLTFAKATRAETTDAGKTAVALQNNMKVGAAEMMDAFDAMALAGKEGQFEVRDMARNAPAIFARMAKLGESGLQGVRGFAAMAQEIRATAGTSDEAATNFENMLDKMTAGDFVRNAKKMGINVQKVFSDANKRGVSPVLEMLKKIRDVTKGDTFKLKELMPDVQANAALSALVAKIPELEAAIGRYGNAGGTVMRDFVTATDNATEAWNRFSSNIQTKAEQIGSRFLPSITEAMNRVSQAMEGQEARGAGVEAISGGDTALEASTREEFFRRYKAAFQKGGDTSDRWMLRASKAWEGALQQKGRGEIDDIFAPVKKLESDRRRVEGYSHGYVPGRGPENPLDARPRTAETPIPERRPDPAATRLSGAYRYGTGREHVEAATTATEDAAYTRNGGFSLRPDQGDIVLARIVDNAERRGTEERTRDAYAEYGQSRIEATGKVPSWWKSFLFGDAAKPDFDFRKQMGIKVKSEGKAGSGILDELGRSEPVRGSGAGDGFAKAVEEGGKKAERAMETSARSVEQIAGSVDTYGAGLKAGNQFAAGLEASAGAVAAAANKTLVQPVANRVPQSPAKIGPLRNLPSMGRKIAQQLAGGIEGEQSPVRAAAAVARRIASATSGTAGAVGGAAPAAGRQVAGVQIGSITIHGVKDAVEAADSIGIELERRLAGTLADVG